MSKETEPVRSRRELREAKEAQSNGAAGYPSVPYVPAPPIPGADAETPAMSDADDTAGPGSDRRGRRTQPGVQPQRFADLVAHREDRVQRRHRLLKDHRDIVSANLAHFFVGK